MGSEATRAGRWELRRVGVYVGCRNNGKWNPSGMVSACFGLEPRVQRLSPSQALQGPAASPAQFLASLRAFAEGQGRDACRPAGPVIRHRLPFSHSRSPPPPRVPLAFSSPSGDRPWAKKTRILRMWPPGRLCQKFTHGDGAGGGEGEFIMFGC